MYYLFGQDTKDLYTYIHPKKHDQIAHVISHLPDWVERCILFGSSLTPLCHDDSDLDLVIVGKRETNRIDTGGAVSDILFYDDMDTLLENYRNSTTFSIYRNIMERGLVIHDKSNTTTAS